MQFKTTIVKQEITNYFKNKIFTGQKGHKVTKGDFQKPYIVRWGADLCNIYEFTISEIYGAHGLAIRIKVTALQNRFIKTAVSLNNLVKLKKSK